MATDTTTIKHHDKAHAHGHDQGQGGHDHYDEGWDGGTEKPFGTGYGKLMMWYFLLSDAFTFAGFLIAYGALRFSNVTWPVPDFVFSTAPMNNLGLGADTPLPLIFVTFMSFLLILSSVTMVRAVQEGARENKNGVVYWMVLTIIGGIGFLGCQAWEWNNLIGHEHMTVTTNPFGSHPMGGEYLDDKGGAFDAGASYLIHGHTHDGEFSYDQRPVRYSNGEETVEAFGPKAFGALFFGITGFHGFHVFSGIVFLIIICLNVASGLYADRKNGYEMVEKIGLYWHFVDLVWVFVFLVFYLL